MKTGLQSGHENPLLLCVLRVLGGAVNEGAIELLALAMEPTRLFVFKCLARQPERLLQVARYLVGFCIMLDIRSSRLRGR